jgi:hypothetical protein
VDKLLAALEHPSNTSPGPDGIENPPRAGKEFLLSMYAAARLIGTWIEWGNTIRKCSVK